MELSAVERAARDAADERDAGLTAAVRRRAGIVHTAPELARFAARAADDLLKRELGLAHGLADRSVALVDPACGPGAFLAAALALAGDRPSAPAAVCGMDSDAAAIGAARAALAPELARAGWPCALRVRDTLRQVRPAAAAALGAVPVVLGNPPWVGSAQPRPAPWLDALLEDFRRDARGERLHERKLGVLADAYVRFVRWACEVARCGAGGAVVAFVTNASYLDGPVHRGMRAALRGVFDALHVLDLGGNALLARSGERDDNVFGVRPAAAVLIGLRLPGAERVRHAPVRYLRLYGPLATKLERLSRARLHDREFHTLAVDPAAERFVPTQLAHDGYDRWPSLAEAMPFHREGVQTNRDAVVVDFDRARLVARLRAFARGERGPELAAADAALAHYDPRRARARVASALEADPDGRAGLLVLPLAYRPLDRRWFAPIAPLCHRPRPPLLAAMARSRFALISARKDRGSAPWAHFGAAREAVDNCWLSNRSSCRARAFPTSDPEGRDNLSNDVAARFAERVGRSISAADFAAYALAVLAAPSFRARHQHALRLDYPRVPLPNDAAGFELRVRAGERLIALLCDPLVTLPPAVQRRPSRAAHAHDDVTVGHHRVLHELARRRGAGQGGEQLLGAAAERVASLAAQLAALDADG